MSKSIPKILIVEDDLVIMKVLKSKLKACFKVDAAVTGSRAMSLIHKNDYALVLLDLVMPEKGGFEVLEQLREEKNKTPIVVFSNLTHEDEKKKAMDLGARGYFVKSDLDADQIVGIVSSLVSQCR